MSGFVSSCSSDLILSHPHLTSSDLQNRKSLAAPVYRHVNHCPLVDMRVGLGFSRHRDRGGPESLGAGHPCHHHSPKVMMKREDSEDDVILVGWPFIEKSSGSHAAL